MEVKEIKEAIKFLEGLLTSDPYSKDIFLPIPKEDFTKINDLLKREMGYPLDRISGNVGRELYKSLKNSKELRDIISLLQQGDKYRQMWEEFKREYNHCYIKDVENVITSWYMVKNIIINMEKEYFPKEMTNGR